MPSVLSAIASLSRRPATGPRPCRLHSVSVDWRIARLKNWMQVAQCMTNGAAIEADVGLQLALVPQFRIGGDSKQEKF